MKAYALAGALGVAALTGCSDVGGDRATGNIDGAPKGVGRIEAAVSDECRRVFAGGHLGTLNDGGSLVISTHDGLLGIARKDNANSTFAPMRTPSALYDDRLRQVLSSAPYGTVCTIRPDGSVDVEVGNTERDPAVALANLLNKRQQECTEPATVSKQKV